MKYETSLGLFLKKVIVVAGSAAVMAKMAIASVRLDVDTTDEFGRDAWPIL